MVFKRNRNQEVNANENKLTALEAAFIKKIADDGFEYLKDDYEDRNEMHIFNSYMSTFQRLELNDPVMAVALIDLLLHEHGYEYISEYMRVLLQYHHHTFQISDENIDQEKNSLVVLLLFPPATVHDRYGPHGKTRYYHVSPSIPQHSKSRHSRIEPSRYTILIARGL